MKKKICIILLLVTAMLLSACQPTPDKPIVVNKNADLVQTVVSANSGANGEELKKEKQTVQDQIKALGGHIKMQMKPNPQVTINVYADIVSPEGGKLPAVRVKPSNLSKEQFDKFIKYFAVDQTVYYQSFNNKTGLNFSKEEITAILTQVKKYLTNKDLPKPDRNGWNEMVKELENGFDGAPTKTEEKKYDGTLTEEKNNSIFNSVTSLKCYMGKTRAAWMELWQSSDGNGTQMTFDNNDYGFGYNTFQPYEGVDAPRMKTTYAEAKSKAEDFVRTMDGDNSSLTLYESNICYSDGSIANYNKDTSPQGYAFKFARNYNGVLVKSINHLSGEDKNINYSKRVSPENMLIIIDDNGINTVYWVNYTQKLETVSDDTPLMDFNSVKDGFEQYVKEKFTWTPDEDTLPKGVCVTLNVKKVELNLMAIPEKDNLENYITVPVWDFIADETFDKKVHTQEGYVAEGEKDISIVTINAINGAIINREQGY